MFPKRDRSKEKIFYGFEIKWWLVVLKCDIQVWSHFLFLLVLLYLRHTDFSIHKGVDMNHRIAILSDIHGDTTALRQWLRMRVLKARRNTGGF